MNPSATLARAVVTALADAGVQEVVLCPGSRSAPLAYALHAADAARVVRLHVRHDERVAGFTGLGLSLGSPDGATAAVVTTSGTAVANLHPAVLEASEAGVPLLVLSADRPHVLRGTWANQTTALQASLFGAGVRAALDLPVPQAGEPLPRAVTTWTAGVTDLLATACGQGDARPGPVHADLAFADPLVPDPGPDPAPRPSPTALRAASAAPEGAWTALRAVSAVSAVRGVLGEVGAAPGRTVVVAGAGPPAVGALARGLAEAAGWPLLAEPSSGARSGPNAVAAYRLLLDDGHLGGAVERVVAIGRPTLSRPVAALLARDDVELVHVVAHLDEPGPGPHRAAARRVVAPGPPTQPPGPCGEAEAPLVVAAGEWLERWVRAGAAAQRTVDAVLDAEADAGRLSGPWAAREVAAHVGAGGLLVTAASSAVRDLDLAAAPWPAAPWPAIRQPPRVLANRGLSGIDGTLSTAAGAALAAGTPTTVLVGDLAFLHDAGGLLLPPGEPEPDLRVVVVDDGGGGIFTGLEHGDPAYPDRALAFERVFATPHGRDLAALALALGVSARRVDDAADLRSALSRPVSGREVLVVSADRSRLRDLHARIRSAVAREVADLHDHGRTGRGVSRRRARP